LQATFSANILAWDRRSRFGVYDEDTSGGAGGDRTVWGTIRAGMLHWFTQSQVVLASADKTAAIDKSLIEIEGKGRQIFRLMQYLVLPF
jgi:hypothetical protein